MNTNTSSRTSIAIANKISKTESLEKSLIGLEAVFKKGAYEMHTFSTITNNQTQDLRAQKIL